MTRLRFAINITDVKYNWFCDGHFGLILKKILQLYVIMIKKKDVFLTAVYYLLQKNIINTYKSMLCILCEKCDEGNFFPDPKEYFITLNKWLSGLLI